MVAYSTVSRKEGFDSHTLGKAEKKVRPTAHIRLEHGCDTHLCYWGDYLNGIIPVLHAGVSGSIPLSPIGDYGVNGSILAFQAIGRSSNLLSRSNTTM